jgi:SAM-dependent methyltransferase
LANSYVSPERASVPDRLYPLHARVCDNCLLVQVDRIVPPGEIFSDYAYFSSYSDSWLQHCKRYVEMARSRFALDSESKVVEIASNDGYLLQYVKSAGIPCLGVEPAANVAEVARANGIPTDVAFFGEATAKRLLDDGHAADLVISNNVLAHVPEIDDFVAGVSLILKPQGVYSVEFPHLLNLIEKTQFDTIYHEHFTYLSVLAIERIFARNGLRIFDIEEVPTHGGSLRVFACLRNAAHALSPNVARVRDKEIARRLDRPEGYADFTQRVDRVRVDFLTFLKDLKSAGKRVVGYGAAAKGNTLFNYCHVSSEDISFVADRSLAKQGKFLPGSRIPVLSPDAIEQEKPDYVFIVPWNLREEIMDQLAGIHNWGGRFVTAIPEITIA